MAFEQNGIVSLLYPDRASYLRHASGEDRPDIAPEVSEQLDLSELLGIDGETLAAHYTTDPDVIRYRQEVFRDMCACPALSDMMRRIAPIMADISELRRMEAEISESTESYLYSITEIELYISCVELLRDGFRDAEGQYTSRAFTEFAAYVREISESEYYAELNKKLGELTARVREIRSVTIGVNLDGQLRPETAGVLSINSERFKSGDVIDKILRFDFKNDAYTCIASLVPFRKSQSENQQIALSSAFYSAIGDVFKSSVRSWKRIVQSYVLENTDFILRLLPEFQLLTKGAELIRELEARGISLVYPEIAPPEAKVFRAKELKNPMIALRIEGDVIGNDFSFDESAMLYVLTGPNRGGKSVITCAVGQAQLMAQLGMPVASASAAISPADGVFTHFPSGSEDTVEKGRLGEECARLEEILSRVKQGSLVLLDESLSSTGSFEGSFIAAEVLAGLSVLGARGIFSTHLHELAASVGEINDKVRPNGGSPVDTLVAGIEEGERSFKIFRQKPDGRSYARDIAEKYGLSFEHIQKKRNEGETDHD